MIYQRLEIPSSQTILAVLTDPPVIEILFRSGVDFRFLFAYYIPVDNPMDKQRENGALLIAASIVAAIRLRGEPIAPTPKITFIISESVQIARLVWKKIQRGE